MRIFAIANCPFCTFGHSISTSFNALFSCLYPLTSYSKVFPKLYLTFSLDILFFGISVTFCLLHLWGYLFFTFLYEPDLCFLQNYKLFESVMNVELGHERWQEFGQVEKGGFFHRKQRKPRSSGQKEQDTFLGMLSGFICLVWRICEYSRRR